MKSDKSISTKESGKTCSLTKLIDNQTNGLGLPDYIPINEVTSYFNTTVRELFDYTERLPLYGQFFSFFVHKDLPSKSVWVGRSIDKCFSLDAEATETEIFQIFEKFNFDISVLTPIPAEIVKDLKEHKECWIIVKPPTQKPNQAIILHHSRLFIRSADLLKSLEWCKIIA